MGKVLTDQEGENRKGDGDYRDPWEQRNSVTLPESRDKT